MIDMSVVRDNTSQLLKEKDVPMHPHLPLLDRGDFRSSVDVCERIIALYSLAGLANGADGDLLKEWLVAEDGWNFLLEAEKKKLESSNLVQDELNELSWKQESLYVLCWCSFIVDEIVWPSSEADLSKVFPSIPPEKPIADFVGSFELRSAGHIIQMLDVYYGLHAAMMHAELWADNQSRDQLKLEVILERRQALEWVCYKFFQWDEISLDI